MAKAIHHKSDSVFSPNIDTPGRTEQEVEMSCLNESSPALFWSHTGPSLEFKFHSLLGFSQAVLSIPYPKDSPACTSLPSNQSLKISYKVGLYWRSGGQDSMLLTQGMQVRSQVRKPRSHMPSGMAKSLIWQRLTGHHRGRLVLLLLLKKKCLYLFFTSDPCLPNCE